MQNNKIKKFNEFNKSKRAIFIIVILLIIVFLSTGFSVILLSAKDVKENRNKNYQPLSLYIKNHTKKVDFEGDKLIEKTQNINDVDSLQYEYQVSYSIGKSVYFNKDKKEKKKNKLYLVLNIKLLNKTSEDIILNLDNINIFNTIYNTKQKEEKNTQKENLVYKFERNNKNTLINNKTYSNEKNITVSKEKNLELSFLLNEIDILNNNSIYINADRSFDKSKKDNKLQAKLNFTKKGLKNIYDR